MSSPDAAPVASTPAVPPFWRKLLHRLRPWALGAIALFVIALAFALLYNNFSVHHQSRAAFDARSDKALESAIRWIAANRADSESNPTMMYMIADMEKMSHDPRLKALLEDYRTNRFHLVTVFDFVMFRLLDPSNQVPVVRIPEMGKHFLDYVWFAHALAPDKIILTPSDNANLFSRTHYFWGMRQKQLLALTMYRQRNDSSPELDRTINYLAEKVARDEHYDFRVTDSYLQRSAFILAAGRPDLVRQRWVERILENQNPDGSWNYCWYGWCRGVFEFRGYDPSHATVQAAWVLTMLKYRYPQWMEEHYR
jgi:hypothetical protein